MGNIILTSVNLSDFYNNIKIKRSRLRYDTATFIIVSGRRRRRSVLAPARITAAAEARAIFLFALSGDKVHFADYFGENSVHILCNFRRAFDEWTTPEFR